MRCLLIVSMLAACRSQSAPDAVAPPASAPQFVDESFESMYPVFLSRRSMPAGEKAARWSKSYRDRWVRWEGVIASFTDNGVTFKQLLATATFDVSLTCDHNAKAPRDRFAVGDRVRYIGRLDSYDDIFRTLYLAHGALVEKVPQGDLGVPFDLSRVDAR